MARPNVAVVIGFILGVGFMLPFTLAFRAPAAAEPTITLQNLADRLATTEKILANVRSTSTLGDTVVALSTKVDTLQSRVGSLDKRVQEDGTVNGAALKGISGNLSTLTDRLTSDENLTGKYVQDAKWQRVHGTINVLMNMLKTHEHMNKAGASSGPPVFLTPFPDPFL